MNKTAVPTVSSAVPDYNYTSTNGNADTGTYDYDHQPWGSAPEEKPRVVQQKMDVPGFIKSTSWVAMLTVIVMTWLAAIFWGFNYGFGTPGGQFTVPQTAPIAGLCRDNTPVYRVRGKLYTYWMRPVEEGVCNPKVYGQ